MLSILIGHAYFLSFDAKQMARAKPYPPLATLQVAARLRDAGHEVALFDAMLSDGPAEFARLLQARRPQLVVLYEDNFNYLSKMCLARMREAACEMVSMARAGGARVVVAGSDASDEPMTYRSHGAEAVLSGEGLAALQALVDRLDREPGVAVGDWCAGVEGLAGDGRSPAVVRVVRRADTRARAGEFDEWSVAWDLVDIERYRAVWMRAHGRFSLNMAASQGCSFHCSWCAKPIWGQQYRQRAPEAVAREMAWMREHLRPDHVWFADDIFGFRPDWVRRFAAALRAAGTGLPFSIQTRADLVSDAMADALREAGCHEAWIGAESGSQKILDAMRKGTTVAELLQARARLGRRGIRVGFFIQLGYLGEGLEDLLATRTLLQAARPDDIGVSVSYPLPGTAFHEAVAAQLGSKTRWEDSADLAMMFRGTYTTEFYRRVRDLMHRQVRHADDGAALAAVDADWTELLTCEQDFRTAGPPAQDAPRSGQGGQPLAQLEGGLAGMQPAA